MICATGRPSCGLIVSPQTDVKLLLGALLTTLRFHLHRQRPVAVPGDAFAQLILVAGEDVDALPSA